MTFDAHRAHLKTRLLQSHVPEGLHEGLIEYVAARRPTGHFLLAVLSNDLHEACARADEDNRVHLFALVFFLRNYAPAACWGSRDRVVAWLSATEPAPTVFE